MKSSLPFVTAAILLVAPFTHAQERTAGSALEAQMSWTALSNKISQVDTQTKALDTIMQASLVCGKAGKLYGPGGAKSDANGCVDIASKPEIKYDECVQLQWKGLYGLCPANMVMAGAVTRNSDSGEWNSFYCCPFK